MSKYSLFGQAARVSEGPESLAPIRRLESSVYNAFSARRNAARIEHYFINLHATRYRIVTYAVATVLVFLIVLFSMLFKNNIFVSFINERSLAMMDTIHGRVSSSITAALMEPKFFTDVFTDLITEPVLIEPTRENAELLTQMRQKASEAGSGMLLWWDIGLPSGELIAIETYNSSEQIVLVHAGTSPDTLQNLTFWISSPDWNSSYPDESGDTSDIPYNATTRTWYTSARRLTKSAWTNIYEGVGSRGKKLMIASVAAARENKKIKAVVAHGVSLDIVQVVMAEQQPSANSRLALTTDTGAVVALTGEDVLITDEFNDRVITKTLEEMEDPIWQCLTNDPRFGTDDEMQMTCRVRGTSYDMHVDKIIIEPASGVKWVLWSVLCMDDFVGNLARVFKSGLIYALVFTCFIWLLLVCGSLVLRYYISSMQNRILEKETVNAHVHHVRPTGILLAVQEMRKLKRSHADNPVVAAVIDSVIEDIQRAENDLFYDCDAVYKEIENPTVRDAIARLYGMPARVVEPDTDSRALSDIESNACLTPVFAGDIRERLSPFHGTTDFLINRTLLIFTQANMKSGVFRHSEFQLVIEATLRELGEPMCTFLTDSVDFTYAVLKKLEPIFNDSQLIMALCIAIMAWHLFMRGRNEAGVARVNRFFLTDGASFKVAMRNLLLSLYVHRAGEDEYSTKWVNLSLVIMGLAETAPVSRHHTVISQFALTPKTFKEEGKFTHHQAVTLVRLIFNLSMVSFLFHKDDVRDTFIRILNPDHQENREEINGYVKCIFSELVDPSMSVLKCAIEPEFFRSMLEAT